MMPLSLAKIATVGLIGTFLCAPLMATSSDSCSELLPKAQALINEIKPDPRLEIFDLIASCRGDKLVISGESSSALLLSHLKEKVDKTFINAEINVTYSPSSNDFNGEEWGLITVPVATLNAKPKFTASIVSQALLGTPVRLLKRSNPWVLIQTPDGYKGWVHLDQFKSLTQEQLGKWNASQLLITQAAVTPASSLDGKPSGLLPEGSIIKGLQINDGKWLVELPSGNKVYVPISSVDFLSTWTRKAQETLQQNPDKFRENLVKAAENLIGTSYLWGGTSSFGVDCSGLISAIFRINGLLVPRDSDMQAVLEGEVQDERHLLPGDLIFFGKKDTNGFHISHVGIYAGHSEFIHSLGSVRKGSFNPDSKTYDAYEKSRFLFGLRLPPSITQSNCIEWMANSPFFSPTPHEMEPCRPTKDLLIQSAV